MSEKGKDYSQPGASRRLFPRFAIDLSVTVVGTRDGKPITIHGRSTDISESGMSLTLIRPLPLNEHVELQFSVPFARETLKLQARVRRVDGTRHGFEFLTLSSEHRRAIARLVAPLTPFEWGKK